jgi:protein-S-isoprenylcysteine O-methyltransferase Ste14
MSGSRGIRPLPPAYLFGALFAIAGLHVWVPLRSVVPRPWNLFGLALVAAGLGMNLAADRLFKSHGTTVKPYQESSALIASGVFRWTRNPMYVGFVAILLGFGVLAGSATALLPWLGFGVLMDRVFIRTEEAMLSTRFPEEWEQYRSRVRRWI